MQGTLLESKHLLVFDLDTLVQPNTKLDNATALLLKNLFRLTTVAIVSEHSWIDMRDRVAMPLSDAMDPAYFVHLALIPHYGAELYMYTLSIGGGWKSRYNDTLSLEEKVKVVNCFTESKELSAYPGETNLIDHSSRITINTGTKNIMGSRLLTALMKNSLPEFNVVLNPNNGAIHVSRKGRDIPFAVDKLYKYHAPYGKASKTLVFLKRGDKESEKGLDAMGIDHVSSAGPTETINTLYLMAGDITSHTPRPVVSPFGFTSKFT